jgi:COP9 signalosome complex subunit 3
MEALKKLVLVQLISRGTVSPRTCNYYAFFSGGADVSAQTTSPPKYTHHNLLRLYKATPYHHFVQSYPHQPDKLHSLLEKEKNTFIAVP